MSFQALRDFTEIMRVLGYPRLISLSNFKHPSFPLVREILVWFIRRFDCDNKHHVSIVLGTEEERITFISHAAEFMIRTVNIQINIKNLYMADVKALEELFNLASLLHEAQLQNTNELIRFENRQIANFNISERLNDLKTIRQIASLVTINGAALYDQLVGETDLRGISNAKIAYQYDSIEIELAIKEIIELLKKGTEETKNHIKNLKDTEHNLEFRIERREIELDRNKKRLQTLKKVRPAFMEELDKLEIALKDLYHDYLQKFRYLAYLEHLYEDAAKVEQERFERRQAATKKQLEQLRIDDANIDSIIECNESILNTNLPNSFPFEGGKKTTENISQDFKKSNRTNISHRKLYGSMSGHHNKNVREVNAGEESSDSDSDLLIDNIDDDDEDDELHSIDPKGSEFPEEKRAISKIDYADDEF